MDAREVRELLDDRPDLEPALEDVRAVDRDTETWAFDDVPVDSGVFGELVGAGVVESAGDEYRLADPRAVEAAIFGEVEESETTDIEFSLPDIDRTAVASLLGLLGLTVAFRMTTYGSVFRDRVVYPANDPYYYVYHVEQGLQNGWGPSNLPGGLETQEPLTVLIMLSSADLAGGLGHHSTVLAVLPVIAAVMTGLLLYLFACEVTGDRRIALASVLVLAVLPLHVARSSAGFVDHHAFDAPWLVMAAWGLTVTLGIDTLEVEWPTIRAISLLGLGVAGSVLAWWAAALLLLPVALSVVVGGTLAVRDDEPLFAPGVATTLGVGLGATLVGLTHLVWGWHDTVVVAVPVLLAVGVAGVVSAVAAWRHLELPPWTFPVTGVGGAAAVTAAVALLAPTTWGRITGQLSRLFEGQNIAEVNSLFSGSTMGWLVLFGLLLVVSIPAMGWGVYRVYDGERHWLAPTSYGVVLLGLGAVQLRYGGELAPFVALFAGVVIVALARWVDAARSPVPFENESLELSIPDRDVAVRIGFVVVLVCGLSAIQAPIVTSDLAIPQEQYETASFIDGHAKENGYDYPQSYVFSPWSWNRMYNYYVNGEAQSYGYAQSNYRPFTFSETPDESYQQYVRSDSYLVTEPVPGSPNITDAMMQSRLHDHYGSRSEGVAGLAHYRALYASPIGDYKAFRIVPGATIEGAAEPDATVTLTTEVDIEGDEFTYERQTTANANGTYSVTVPYPGEYDLEGAATEPVSVSEAAVNSGETVRA
ncbi:hypothetical protein KY092_17035 [Natronomonas gomsonensis]|uniref:STT3 domain-containing protein n=1 Tax=Natronomonas gomsonensis TaxID=1046043 RepID=UPI0020CA29B8|nr:STT3 domain-containing protein [Natronomonas gomsonensis]MCY4732260.1 hypothetical protein [Natronomonas gomsonensis]